MAADGRSPRVLRSRSATMRWFSGSGSPSGSATRRRSKKNSRSRTWRSITSAARACSTATRRRSRRTAATKTRSRSAATTRDVHQPADQRTAARRLCVHDGAAVPGRCVQRAVPDRTRGFERTGARGHRRESGEGIHVPSAPQPRLDAAVGRWNGGEPRPRAARRRRAVGLHARIVRAVRRGGAPDGGAVSRRIAQRWKPLGAKKSARRLHEATLRVPDDTWSIRGGRDGVHTEHLGYLLAEMQFMQRAYPGQRW